MASEEKFVITAIRDMSQEGFVAASLKRSGWQVIYRATSIIALREKLAEYPNALLLTSDDFGEIGEKHQGASIQLRGRSHPLTTASALDPQSDFELAEMIRSQESITRSVHISATTAKVIAISSIGARTGSTTLAITLAEEISRLSERVLLVEGNRIHPKIAHHFQVHRIRGEITQSQFGFSICEVTDIQGLNSLASEADNFDFIIVDLGPLALARNGGQRVEDLLLTWSSNSRAKRLMVARDDAISKEEASRFLSTEASSHQFAGPTVFMAPSKVLSKRERMKLIEEQSEHFGVQVDIFSRDVRSIEKMENSHSTLRLSAPQSLIIGDVARYLERERYS